MGLTVDALRVLCLGRPPPPRCWQALAWIGGLTAVAVPAGVAR